MKTPHSSVYPGKRVRVVMKSGEIIIDKFVERTGKYIVLERHRLTLRNMRALTIYKPTESNT